LKGTQLKAFSLKGSHREALCPAAHWLNGLVDVREVSTLITLSLTETKIEF